MAQQAPIPLVSQFQGSVVVPLGQLPYSSPYLANGWTSYTFTQHSPRPLANGAAWCDSGTFPRFVTAVYAEAPSQTANDVINWGTRSNSLGAFNSGYLRTMDDRLYGYGSTGGGAFQNLDFWCFLGDRGITQTTKPNMNGFPVITSGSFIQGELGFGCDMSKLPVKGNPPVPFYSRNVFGSAFVFSPFNNTMYPDGSIRVKWGMGNAAIDCPFPYGIAPGPAPAYATAYNSDGRYDWSVWGTPAGANTMLLAREDCLQEFLGVNPRFCQAYFNVTLDDATLNSRISNQLGTLIPNSAGWTMVIDLSGGDPAKYNPKTLYNWIVIFLSMDMTQYWTLQFSPNNSAVDTCLRWNTFGGVPWSVAADIDGYLYVSNNRQLAGVTGGSTLMSGRNKQTVTIPGFDPSIAWNLAVPNATFALPCFDPCAWGDY